MPFPTPGGLLHPGIEPTSFKSLALAGGFFTTCHLGRLVLLIAAASAAAKSLQSCPTLCDPIEGSPPGSSVPGILQARILEWGAVAFSTYLLQFCLILLWGSVFVVPASYMCVCLCIGVLSNFWF